MWFHTYSLLSLSRARVLCRLCPHQALAAAEKRFVETAADKASVESKLAKVAGAVDESRRDAQTTQRALVAARAECAQAHAQLQSMARRLETSVAAERFVDANERHTIEVTRLTRENQALVTMLNELVAAMQQQQQQQQ